MPTKTRIVDADPCALVTAQEAGAALGGTARSTTIGTPGEQHSCHWSGPEAASLMVTVNDVFCDGLVLALDQNMLTPEQQRIDDIGQGGMLTQAVGSAFIRAKGGCFSITATRRNVPLPKATLIELARTATSRL